MNIADIVIIAVVVVLAAFGGRKAIDKARGKGGCCSGGGDSKSNAKSFKATKITDTDEANYPYSADLTISGMTCENCVKHVANALNSIEGTWARVDLQSRNAHVLSKSPVDEEAYRKVVSEAGYRVI